MKIEIAPASQSGKAQVRLWHRNEESFWDIQAYSRTTGATQNLSTDKIFGEINAFWAQLPEARQSAIWDIFKQIRAIVSQDIDLMLVRNQLIALCQQLYQQMPVPEIQHWCGFHSGIRIPSTLKDELGLDDPAERTYLKSDYRGLVVLAVALRPMLPIWGEFINNIKKDVGALNKETVALSLLYSTDLILSEPVSRLRTYIESSADHLQEGGPSPTAVLSAIGKVEMPEWVLAQTMVRRLAMCEVSSLDDTVSIISNLYQYVKNLLVHNSMDKQGAKFGGRVSEKNREGGEEADNISSMEQYKVKQETDDGSLVAINVYTENPYRMAQMIEENVDLDRVKACLEAVQYLESLPVESHQVTLVQWSICKVLSPKAVPQMTKPALLRSMAVAQAVLWHRGFFDLAALITAEPIASETGIMVGAFNQWAKISKELMDELTLAYPHYQPQRGRQVTPRQLNPAAKAADIFCDMVTYRDWKLHCPAELMANVRRQGDTTRLLIPPDIRNHVARLFLYRQ